MVAAFGWCPTLDPMISPTTPPPPGSSEPPVPAGGVAPRDYKPWIPAIALGVVLVLLIVFFFLRSDGDDDAPPSSTTTSSTSTTSTSTSTSTTSTTSPPPTTAPPTTAPPTTAPPTTAPPTTAATTTPTNPEGAALISQCNSGDEFACYEVGRQGLTPPASVKNPASWKNKSDDEVASACQQDLNVTACYVAGTRGLVLGD